MSCQERPGPSGAPERASHTTAVERWVVSPSPRTRPGVDAARPRRAMTPRTAVDRAPRGRARRGPAPGRPAGSRDTPAPRRRRSRRAGAPARPWCRRRARARAASRAAMRAFIVQVASAVGHANRRGPPLTAAAGVRLHARMLVKMRRDATADEVATVERKLHDLGFKTGKLEGVEITLVGVYGDISKLPQGEIAELAGRRAADPDLARLQAGGAEGRRRATPIYKTVRDRQRRVRRRRPGRSSPGPCSVESERQIMDAARMVKEAGCDGAPRRRRQVSLEPVQRLGGARRVGRARRCATGSS